ncbi:hypothetical protein O181_045968 [Austropuccinia psidii MF-1]|uniref:WD40 repeat-like protein n=1 Tax=Austropuccinia psidii MF-1 TaxID=1389203 RepID=A0A9Q3DRC4_9BASI|nr:hypothetical protein [Austropuccinia psidii MF-1]
MQTVDERNLFRTDTELNAARVRYEKSLKDKNPTFENGYPILLPTKPLDFIIDDDEDQVYVAENGFVIQRVNLKTGKINATFKGHTGPVTSIALYNHRISNQQQRKILFTGSWDKTIKTWDAKTQILLSSTTGHVDFVKSIEIIPNHGILASGSTDRDIRLWDLKAILRKLDWCHIDNQYSIRKEAIHDTNQDQTFCNSNAIESKAAFAMLDLPSPLSSVINTPSLKERTQWPSALYDAIACIGILKSHTRPVDILKAHPMVTASEQETRVTNQTGSLHHLLISADTMGALKIWRLENTLTVLDSTTWPHKTSINDIQVGCEVRHDIDHQTNAQLWTASADNSVLLSTVDLLPISNKRITNLIRIEQPYYVRCLLSLPLYMAKAQSQLNYPNWLLTGSTDEKIRICDLEELEDKKSETKPRSTPNSAPGVIPSDWMSCLSAHWHEVNCLGVWHDKSSRKLWLISSSLDGTLRRWELSELERYLKQKVTPLGPSPVEQSAAPKGSGIIFTEEEEAELAELVNGMS